MGSQGYKDEIYISTDIEGDGPIPGKYSMVSLASVALTWDGKELDCWTANLFPLDKAKRHPATMKWWTKFPEAWAAANRDQRYPEEAMLEYKTWLERLKAKHNKRLVFVGYPATYDFMFVNWYLMYFARENPMGFAGLDIKSFMMAKLGWGYKDTTKKTIPKSWFPDIKHTHIALDDAREQGLLFCNVLKTCEPINLGEIEVKPD